MPRDLLLEIGTEELPPKSLRRLSEALSEGISRGLDDANLDHGEISAYAAPRRLAVRVDALSERQPDAVVEKRGPAVKAAYADDGSPTKALLGFARGQGIEDLSALTQVETDKGAWVVYRAEVAGEATETLVTGIIEKALSDLPIEKRMRWGSSRAEFVRPVKWIVLLSGSEVIDTEILGLPSGRTSRGHRFMGNDATIDITSPADYVNQMREGHVIADFAERQAMIEAQLSDLASRHGGVLTEDAALLDEVTALVEWPVAMLGSFDEDFLAVPDEALVSAMREHQRYFHLRNEAGDLLPCFITVANLESGHADAVIAGNERVIRPRLADARFFYDKDRNTDVATRLERLGHVVFQSKLGSFGEKASRIEALAGFLADHMGADSNASQRAGLLCKTDLVSDMVGEFPDLQGIMGGYYATAGGEPPAVASAIRDHYLPAFAGDSLPATPEGCAVALADRLDTMVGLFGIGEPPSGSRDPFALRRQSLGVIRICIENKLELSLRDALEESARLHAQDFDPRELLAYILDRLEGYYADQGISADTVQAVRYSRDGIDNLVDADRRIRSVAAFRSNPAADDLVAANKRVLNILRKAEIADDIEVVPDRFDETAERELHAAILGIQDSGEAIYDERLAQLAGMREVIGTYFDDVMVMSEDASRRENRLATLAALRTLFVEVADFSRLNP